MNKADVEFTVGLNTSPAEQQLHNLADKIKNTSHIYNDTFRDFGQGFKMVGTPYQNGNNYGVPSTNVLERSVTVVINSLDRFARILDTMSARMVNFQTVGSPYTPTSTMYANNRVAGYLPSPPRTVADWAPANSVTSFGIIPEHYTREQVDKINASVNNRGIYKAIEGGLFNFKDTSDYSGKNIRSWSPSEYYTREQVDEINKRHAKEQVDATNNLSPSDIFDALIYKRKSEEGNYNSAYEKFRNIYSPEGARGMYEIWNNLFGKSPLLLEAPKAGATDVEVGEKEAPEEQAKDIVEEDKKDNEELKEKVLLWSKILTIIYGVKKVIEGLVKSWKFIADTATSRNANINQESGFFSTDPVGAMRSNIDRTRPALYAGIRNMGANTPISKEGLDYTTTKFTEMWSSAMAGRNVDSRTAIDVQRLKDFFGLDLTVAGLLTGAREGKTATDIQIDAMDKIEKNLAKLNDADNTTKGQIIDSLKNVLGEEMINAIVANYNKNLKIDSPELKLTVAGRLLEAGGSAMSPQDLTQKTTLAVTALADFKNSLETLKNTIIVDFAPAFVSVTETLTKFIDWLNKKMTKTQGPKNEIGLYESNIGFESAKNKTPSTGAKKADSGKVWGSTSERQGSAREMLKGAKSAFDIIDAIAFTNPLIATEGDIEQPEVRRFSQEFAKKMASGEDLDAESYNPIERYFAKYQYTEGRGKKAITYTGKEAIKKATEAGKLGSPELMGPLYSLFTTPENDFSQEALLLASEKLQMMPFIQKEIQRLFGEGGEFDFDPETMTYTSYKFNPKMYKDADSLYEAIRLFKKSIEVENWGREYIKSFNLPSKEELAGEDKVLDFKEVKFTVVFTDQAGREIGSKELVGSVQ